MAAAVFEALFHGDDDYDFDRDPGAVVIWFSDDPSLNEQSPLPADGGVRPAASTPIWWWSRTPSIAQKFEPERSTSSTRRSWASESAGARATTGGRRR